MSQSTTEKGIKLFNTTNNLQGMALSPNNVATDSIINRNSSFITKQNILNQGGSFKRSKKHKNKKQTPSKKVHNEDLSAELDEEVGGRHQDTSQNAKTSPTEHSPSKKQQLHENNDFIYRSSGN